MYLPNALITEYGIVNYLCSLHATNLTVRPASVLEITHGFGDQSIAGQLYENAYGKQPNTHTGSHMASNCYRSYLSYNEGSLFHGRKTVSKYIYPIRMTPHITNFAAAASVGSKLTGEYFWKHMSTIALNDARQGRAIIFIDYAQENYIDKTAYLQLHESLQYSGIPKSNIILAFNSFNAKEVYESWFTEEERKLEVHNWPFVMSNTAHHYNLSDTSRMTVNQFQEMRHVIRNKHFIFKIRRPRDHRLLFLYKIASDNLLEKADWSCLTPLKVNEQDINSTQNKYRFEMKIDQIEKLCKQTPHNLDSEQNDYNSVSAWTDKSPDAHKNSYLYLCTETFTTGEYKSLTEKVFKPIVNFQPFLFIAYPGALRLLQELGFKTFAPFIDESYDDETDKVKRMGMIYSELKRICEMSKEEIHNWYWSMEDTLIHNYHHFLDIWKREGHSIKLISYLHNRLHS
jgi:hypothetical protein